MCFADAGTCFAGATSKCRCCCFTCEAAHRERHASQAVAALDAGCWVVPSAAVARPCLLLEAGGCRGRSKCLRRDLPSALDLHQANCECTSALQAASFKQQQQHHSGATTSKGLPNTMFGAHHDLSHRSMLRISLCAVIAPVCAASSSSHGPLLPSLLPGWPRAAPHVQTLSCSNAGRFGPADRQSNRRRIAQGSVC